MSGPPVAEATVIVLNVDAEVPDFYDFAQRHALDLIGSAPPVWMWTIAAGGNPPGTAEHVLGRWPRRFASDDSAGEALADTVEEYVRTGKSVGLVLLVRSPERLLRRAREAEPTDDAVPLLTPLAEALSRSRQYRTRFWSICAVLEGPQTALAGASRIVARPIDGRRAARAQGFATGLDTVMFLNPDYEGQVRLASDEQRACLRLAIDLARAGPDVWDALRPGPQSGRGRLFWLEVDGAGQPSRPHNLRRAVTATIEKKLSAAIDPKEEEDDSIGSSVRQLLRKYAPRVEHSGIARLRFEWGSVFDDKARYRGSALSAINAADTRIRRELENHYRAQIEQIRHNQEEGDAIYRTAQEDADRLRLSVPDGGLGAHSEHALNAEIDKLATQRQEWRSAARRARDAVLGLHRAAQDRADPAAPGVIDLGALEPWVQFEAAENDARASAADLPVDWRSRLWTWIPALSLATVCLANAEPWDGLGPLALLARESLTDMPTPSQLWLGFTIAVFLVYALVERKYHLLYGDALAQARKRAEAVAGIIDQALADTQEFIANARASLIAEQLAGRLRELIRQLAARQFRQDYDNVVKVRGGRADALDPDETNAAAKLSDVARNAPLEQWIKEMIGAWANDHPPAARASVAVLRTANSHAFEVDEAALRPDGLSIVSTWATQDFSVSAAPLLPLTETPAGPGELR